MLLVRAWWCLIRWFQDSDGFSGSDLCYDDVTQHIHVREQAIPIFSLNHTVTMVIHSCFSMFEVVGAGLSYNKG